MGKNESRKSCRCNKVTFFEKQSQIQPKLEPFERFERKDKAKHRSIPVCRRRTDPAVQTKISNRDKSVEGELEMSDKGWEGVEIFGYKKR